jgi:hypothetical protein
VATGPHAFSIITNMKLELQNSILLEQGLETQKEREFEMLKLYFSNTEMRMFRWYLFFTKFLLILIFRDLGNEE